MHSNILPFRRKRFQLRSEKYYSEQKTKFKFLLKVLDQRYDRIPIHYNDRNIFVDHNTRQHYTANNEVNFVGFRKDSHQLDINSNDSWYHLRPAIVP